MGPGTDPTTAADRRRFAAMEATGCVVCRVFFERPCTPGDVHHVLRGGRRIGHQATICLHPWYHRGNPPEVRYAGRIVQLTVAEAERRYGPSLARNRLAFEARFGTEEELLEMQDAVLGAYWALTDGVPRGSTPDAVRGAGGA